MTVKRRLHLIAVAVEEVVVADAQIEQMPRRDARRVVVVVFGPRRGYVDERRTVTATPGNVDTQSSN